MRLTPTVLLLAAALPCVPGTPARQTARGAGFDFVARPIALPSGGAEIVAVSPNGRLGAVTQVAGRVRTFKLPKGKVTKKPVDVSDIGEPTSVAFVDDETLMVVVKDDPNPGTLVVANAKNGKITATVPIGIGPDSIAVDRTRRLAVVSIEDEETEVDDPTACPPENVRPGSIQIVDFSAGLSADDIVVTTLPVDLSALASAGCPGDPQPEFVAIHEAAGRAYVTVQENNAIAVVDLETKTIGLERARSVVFFDVTDPTAPTYICIVEVGERPEGLVWVPSLRLLLTGNETGGDVTAVEVRAAPLKAGHR